jgi:hypothetical protein
MVDALLNDKQTAISEARRAIEMLPISKDAVDGPGMVVQLAVVYAWTNELDLAFDALGPMNENAKRYLLRRFKARFLVGTSSERSAL